MSLSSLVILVSNAHAQTINLYSRLLDPLAIAKLDEPDFGPIRLAYGTPYDGHTHDPADTSYWLLASDTGSGVLTHLYLTTRAVDSLTNLIIYIDGKIFRKSSLNSFFARADSELSPPLDSILGEARICDIQIPYHTGFRIDYRAVDPGYWYDFAWRPVSSELVLPRVGNLSDTTASLNLQKAESVFRNPLIRVDSGTSDSVGFDAVLLPGNDITVLALSRSAYLTSLHLKPASYGEYLDSVSVEITYDGEPIPSFKAPLLALFGGTLDFRSINSIALSFSKSDGLDLHVPIPFARSMTMILTNRSTEPVSIAGGTRIVSEAIDVNRVGYLHSFYNAIAQTNFGVPHHVLHRKGKGKFLGLLMGIRNLQSLTTYEGDAIFQIDSQSQNSFHYEGTEDYFNGAQYFSYGAFNSPFGGTPDPFSAYYRFHYLDEIDFNKSLDFDFQHGQLNDSRENYRTLALWYERQIPFRVDRDTVRPTETWRIDGNSFTPNIPIVIRLDSIVVFSLYSDLAGSFSDVITIPSVVPGVYSLSVNGILYPSSILVQSQPSVQILSEPKPVKVHLFDTVSLSGEGWLSGDSITITLGGVTAHAQISIDSSFHLTGSILIPLLPSGSYFLHVEGMRSGPTNSIEPISVDGDLKWECEDLWDSLSAPNQSTPANLSSTFQLAWSKSAVVAFRPAPDSVILNLRLWLPISDTFNVFAAITTGRNLGDYSISFDGEPEQPFLGFRDNRFYSSEETLLCTKLLSLGFHTIHFRYTGHDPEATDSLLWADYIRLVPVTPFSNSVSTFQSDMYLDSLRIAPEPTQGALILYGFSEGRAFTSTADILDETGRLLFRRPLVPVDLESASLSLADLPNGVYWIRVRLGNRTITRATHLLR